MPPPFEGLSALAAGAGNKRRVLTIREAKARLNELVEAATQGEQVMLMRGSKHVAVLVPVSTEELELPPRLGDPQTKRLSRRLASEPRAPGERRAVHQTATR
jgi:prevent-host-death family protein